MQIHRTFALALLSLCFAGCANGPPAFTDSDRAAIRANIDAFTAAVNRRDYAEAASAYADDGLVMPPNAPIAEGRKAIRQQFESFEIPVKFTQPVVEVDGEGGLAYARGTAELTLTPPGARTPMSDTAKIITVWRKQPDGSWKVIRAIWNSNLSPR
ncbi:MAG: SgcJ/EcaC family oxidoreductase [Gemmatimonadota bacterium]|nr:SgcJ/EcaC family oxidoreductase [Gemmatimonadota bacterium]